MRLEAIRTWQWMLIAPLVGLMIGYVRYKSDPGGIGGIENNLHAQHIFEERSIKRQALKPSGERFYFDNVRVVRAWVKTDAGKLEQRYVVLGKDMKKSGVEGHNDWTPTFFVTETKYVPKLKKINAGTADPQPTMLDKLQVAAEKLRLKDPDPKGTVLDYLKKLQVQEKIAFRYEWWREPRVSMAAWAAACFIVIGVIWPTVINLVAFGTPLRPREEKAAKAKRKAAETGPKSKVTAADMEELRRLEEEMERKLKEGAPERGVGIGPSDQPAEAPVKPLAGGETVAATPVAEKDQTRKAFGMDGDDIYPTEVHGHSRKHDE